MSTTQAPHAEDLFSVGSRISWGAILAGSFLAVAMLFLFSILGAAVGLSAVDQVRASTLHTGSVVWSIVGVAIALFVGGLITSLFTVGENKVEAVVGGLIMWGFLTTLLIALGAAGANAGLNGMTSMATVTQRMSEPNWEAGARDAGVTTQQIEEWRAKGTAAVSDPQAQQAIKDTATRLAWYTFFGTWISMMAAAFGAWVGAGPTFRVDGLRLPGRASTVVTAH